MNDSQTRGFEMLVRVRDFGGTHGASFPASSLGGQRFSSLQGIVGELEQHGTAQSSGSSAAKTSTGAKKVARDGVRRRMAAISETARAMEITMPGISATFRIPNTNGDQALLNTARAFIVAATPLESEFIQREMPEDFIEDLNDAIETFQSACNSQSMNREKRVTATAAIQTVINRGMEIVRELDAIVRNKFRGDEPTLAAWESARHIERQPRRHTETSEPEPPTPG
ncbi:MAG TPA: hypothetical protein VGX92_12590 [Pyrinomonadaceae bacterium]|jgi:hypothetical protein|nr:hypothetical protein [Pyrinomonadaceae bacterium]